MSDHAFVSYCQPLGRRYCQVRLRTYGGKYGAHLTPQQLRHSCATLLLSAGTPVVSVQTLLGHEKIDTTLVYARLYDGRLAADYYRAMRKIEPLFGPARDELLSTSVPGELVALADALGGALNDAQRETLAILRRGLLALAAAQPAPV